MSGEALSRPLAPLTLAQRYVIDTLRSYVEAKQDFPYDEDVPDPVELTEALLWVALTLVVTVANDQVCRPSVVLDSVAVVRQELNAIGTAGSN